MASSENNQMRLMMVVYSLVFTLLLLLYLPGYALRYLLHKRSIRLLERAGRVPQRLLRPKAGPRIWIHAVSVGEVNVVRPLVETLASEGFDLYVSTTTDTGQKLASQSFSSRAQVFYFPLDWKWTCLRYLRALKPDLILLAETEIWPRFIETARAEGVPLAIVNGRISDRSFRRYRRIRFFLRPLLGRISAFCMQSQVDVERIIRLGAPPNKVLRTGNLKYDFTLRPDDKTRNLVKQLRPFLKKNQDDLVWVCGSTREGEEELLLPVFEELRREFPLRLLLAPRHPQRAAQVVKLLEERQLPHLRRTEVFVSTPQSDGDQVLLLDTIGELNHLYGLADVVFVGGSLVPTGGHNIIEAASHGKAILFGPHMHNFREIARTFVTSGAAVQVKSAEDLKEQLRPLLQNRDARERLGTQALQVARENQGAVDLTIRTIGGLLQRAAASDEKPAV
jgi:3-deoxy-D-manno-octulosonic-acid transferase